MKYLQQIIIFLCLLYVAGGPCIGGPSYVYASDEPVDFLNDEFYEIGLESEEYVIDRFEPINRVFFEFNDKAYIWVMEPVATVYSHAVPYDIRVCFHNFFRNLEEPLRFVNTLLQGRFSDAGDIFTRFTINSTLGVFGLGDAAGRVFGFPPVEATLGETLANWGVGEGSYIVVPLYGSSTLRDFTGTVVDSLGMTSYYSLSDDIYVKGGVYLGKETNNISMRIGEYEDLKQVFFDPYVAFRNAYFQHKSHRSDDLQAD